MLFLLKYWKLLGAVALIAVAFGAGWQANGWRLGEQVADLQGQLTIKQQTIDEYITAVSARDVAIDLLRGQIDSVNTIVAGLEQDNTSLRGAVRVAERKLAELQAEHDTNEGPQLLPLPADCVLAVREFSLRLGAQP
jgi:hypothetical protein